MRDILTEYKLEYQRRKYFSNNFNPIYLIKNKRKATMKKLSDF